MERLVWDDSYLTGLPTVDEQHHQLVDLINRLGEMLVAESKAGSDAAALDAAFLELRDYAEFHFATEEKMMMARRLDPGQLASHVQQHQSFITQVDLLQNSRHSMRRPAESIHGFLASWLVFQVLGEDHAMARQLTLIAAGETPAVAMVQASGPENKLITVLLAAMKKLYSVMAEQNLDLAEANRRLNEKILERTRKLEETTSNLEAGHQATKVLLVKIEEAQNQVLQSEKMASIGQLAAGVAHEINNPIGFVNSNLGTLAGYANQLLAMLAAFEAVEPQLPAAARAAIVQAKQETDLDYLRQDIGNLLSESAEGLARVKKIVNDLKDFSRVGEAEWQEADLVAGVESTLNVVWNEIKYKADVVREMAPLPLVRCVPAQLNQVFMNLLVNAAQAIEERGTIVLRSGVELDHIWIEVADSGKGMPTEVQQRIFEPFFTTKPVGKGTGLGLSLSYDIVTKHGGRFEVVSTPGAGTTFRLWLPIDGPAATAEEGQAS